MNAYPFVSDIYVLLDQLVAEERAKQQGTPSGTESEVVVDEKQLKVVGKKRKKKS